MWTKHLDGYLKICISLKRKPWSAFWPLSLGVAAGLCSAISKPEKVSWAQGSSKVGQGELHTWQSTSQKQGDDKSGRKESHHLLSANCVPGSAWTHLAKVLSGPPHFLWFSSESPVLEMSPNGEHTSCQVICMSVSNNSYLSSIWYTPGALQCSFI